MVTRPIVTGLTITFAAMSVALAIAGLFGNPIGLVVAIVFAGIAGLLYYQASGRLARRVYRSVEDRASMGTSGARRQRRRTRQSSREGVGAGPKDDWTGPHQRRGRDSRARQRQQQTVGDGGTGGQRATTQQGMSSSRAYDVLDLDPGADQATIRAAYRERIKEVHPDTETGDEDSFRRVRSAYERLSD